MKRLNGIAIGTLALAPFCFAQQASPAKAAEKKQPRAVKTGPLAAQGLAEQGLVVVKDADTGEIRQATPAEIGAVNPGTAASLDAAPAQPTVNADGSRSLLLGQESMSYMVVSKTADGRLVTSEVVGDKNAKAAVETVQPKTPSLPERKAGELK